MTALAIFAAITTVLTPLLRLRAHLRPQPYDAPVWCWRLRLAWRAYRSSHGHPRNHARARHPYPRSARNPARRQEHPRKRRPAAPTAARPGHRSAGRGVPVLDLTAAVPSRMRARTRGLCARWRGLGLAWRVYRGPHGHTASHRPRHHPRTASTDHRRRNATGALPRADRGRSEAPGGSGVLQLDLTAPRQTHGMMRIRPPAPRPANGQRW